jgi:intracellular septation protein
LKILLDFLPLALFFGMFKYAESHREWAATFATTHLGFMVSGGVIGLEEAPVLLATVVVMLATLFQVIVLKALRQKVDTMLWVSLVLVVVLGAATVYFHSETFIKWKPTALYWAMALGFWAAETFWGKNLLKSMLKDVPLPEPVWKRMNWMWVAFFAVMGVLNLWVAYAFSTSTWTDFKVFGTTALMLLFVVGQGFYLNRHLPPPEAEQAAPKTDSQP